MLRYFIALALFSACWMAVPVAVSYAAPRCLEDEPCWAWSKMGDHRRGVVVTSGKRLVVGPCTFARLHRRDRIDWSRTPHLRGDYSAIRKGCHRTH